MLYRRANEDELNDQINNYSLMFKDKKNQMVCKLLPFGYINIILILFYFIFFQRLFNCTYNWLLLFLHMYTYIECSRKWVNVYKKYSKTIQSRFVIKFKFTSYINFIHINFTFWIYQYNIIQCNTIPYHTIQYPINLSHQIN